MAPKNKFSKEQIVDAGFNIAEKEGLGKITAKKVAKQLKSSVAPIYVNFNDIEELKRAVIQKIILLNQELSMKTYTGNRFLDMGIASLKFANDYRILFREYITNKSRYISDPNEEEALKAIINEMRKDEFLKDLSDDELSSLLLKMRVFTMGLSTMLVNDLLPEGFNEAECIELLSETGDDIINSILSKKNK